MTLIQLIMIEILLAANVGAMTFLLRHLMIKWNVVPI